MDSLDSLKDLMARLISCQSAAFISRTFLSDDPHDSLRHVICIATEATIPAMGYMGPKVVQNKRTGFLELVWMPFGAAGCNVEPRFGHGLRVTLHRNEEGPNSRTSDVRGTVRRLRMPIIDCVGESQGRQ
jgi:hypothetical protein